MEAEPETRLRADARRNREQIVAAAKQVFLESGPDVPMEEIARRAEVGVGTLYRRFPDRGELIRAVARDNFATVLAEATAAATEEPNAWAAIVRLLSRSRELRLSLRLALMSPMARAIVSGDPKTVEFRAEMMRVLDLLVTKAQAEGVLRKDVGSGDLAVMCRLTLERLPLDLEVSDDVILDRVIGVMLDGLRAQPGSPLPGRPLTSDDLSAR
ncbi:MAG: TetR/AcrR family transcriptional regulator [Nocardiopsaceae bacterium]|nr:TetR/AcrR family transcriptional regulator [Nocardiopsaceae bacterium]